MLKKISFFCLFLYLMIVNCEFVLAQNINKDGWNIDIVWQSGIPNKINATYTIMPDDISDDKINIDLSFILKFLNYHLSNYHKYLNTNPSFNLSIKNESGKKITFDDYEFTTTSYQEQDKIIDSKVTDMIISGKDQDTIALGNILNTYTKTIKKQDYDFNLNDSLKIPIINTFGFDKKFLRTSSLFYRTQSPAMIALLGQDNLTVKNISDIDNIVKQKLSFINIKGEEINLEEDLTRTYSQYLKSYYDVKTLDDLTYEQLYNYFNSNIMIEGYDSLKVECVGNGCKFIKINDLNTNVSDEFKKWGKAIVSKYNDEYVFSKFYFLESDIELQQLAYKYLYNNIIRFTFDSKIDSLSSLNQFNDELSLYSYINKNDVISKKVYQLFNYGAEFSDGDIINFPNIEVKTFLVNAFDNNNLFDYGLSLSYNVLEDYKRDVVLIQYGNNRDMLLENMIYKLQYRDQDNNWSDLSEYNYLKTDKEGMITINNLGIGNYRFVAKLVPAGYDLPIPIEFSVKEVDESTPLLLNSILKKSNSNQQLNYVYINSENDILNNIIKYIFIVTVSLISIVLIIFSMKKVLHQK